jgi:hypothetical protein
VKTPPWLLIGLMLGAGAAQGAEPPALPPPALPPRAAAAPAASSTPGTVPSMPGARVATGQAPVVGGNAAGARERALDEAMRQAVDLSIAELTDAPTRAAQAKAIKAIEAKARSLVPRYRTLQEGEERGVYSVQVEAEVDEVALRRKIDRWSAGAPGPAAAPPGAPSVLIVPGDRVDGTAGFLPVLVSALSRSKVRARAEGGSDGTVGAATQAAARAGLGSAGLVVASIADEGMVRGTGKLATACRATVRLLAAPSGAALGERAASVRVFNEHPEAGRPGCLARLAHELAGEIAGALSATIGAGPGDLRILTLDAEVLDPEAVVVLLKSVRSVGAVSSAELQRVGGGHAEIRVRTRSAAAPLAAALARDADALIALTNLQTSGDTIRLQARLRAPISPSPTSPTPGSPP